MIDLKAGRLKVRGVGKAYDGELCVFLDGGRGENIECVGFPESREGFEKLNYALERVDEKIIDEALKSFEIERAHHSNVII